MYDYLPILSLVTYTACCIEIVNSTPTWYSLPHMSVSHYPACGIRDRHTQLPQSHQQVSTNTNENNSLPHMDLGPLLIKEQEHVIQ